MYIHIYNNKENFFFLDAWTRKLATEQGLAATLWAIACNIMLLGVFKSFMLVLGLQDNL